MSDDRFIEQHRELVQRLARKVRSELDLGCDPEDLEAYGFQGLVQARERFDPDRGVQFSTFAYYRVRGAILDGVRQMSFLPRRAHRRLRLAEATDQITEPLTGARGQVSAGGPALEDTLAAVDGALGQITAAFALAAVGQDDTPGAQPAASPEDALLDAEAVSRLREAVQGLPDRERALVTGVYFEGRRFDEVAVEIGVSKSWASRLHGKALDLLRTRLGSGEG